MNKTLSVPYCPTEETIVFKQVEILKEFDGLVVQRMVDDDTYAVTHKSSGKLLDWGFTTVDDAFTGLCVYVAQDCDWTQPVDEHFMQDGSPHLKAYVKGREMIQQIFDEVEE
jgi:hypothetical protein